MKNINEIYILGHSLSYIDEDYFKEIKKNIIDESKWVITYFDGSDYKQAQNFVEKMKIKNFSIININKLYK